MAKRTNGQDGTPTALAPQPEGSTALAPLEDMTELDGFGQSDIVIPVCSLVQPMSQGKGTPGQYGFPDGRSVAEMRVVVVHMMPTRAAWGDISEGIQEPLCRSADRKAGYSRYPERIATGATGEQPLDQGVELSCVDCPLGPTNRTFQKRADGLWCPDGYTLLLADFQTAQPFMFYVKGMAFKEVKAKIVSPTITRSRQSGQYEPWSLSYLWQIKLIEQPGKKYYVPEIMPDGELEPAHAAYYAAMYAELGSRAKAQTLDEPEPAPVEESAPGLDL